MNLFRIVYWTKGDQAISFVDEKNRGETWKGKHILLGA
jgi:membrane-bound inhibitor of C-type lysozyme